MKKNKEKTKRILSLIVIFFSILIVIFSIGFVSADLILDFNTETSFDTGSSDPYYYCGDTIQGKTLSLAPSPSLLCDSGATEMYGSFTDADPLKYNWICEITIYSDGGATQTKYTNYCYAYKAAAYDTTPPIVTIISPSSVLSEVSGTIYLKADAYDESGGTGIAKVKFKVDGAIVGEDTTSPYELTYDTKVLTNSYHSVTAIAIDGAGNIKESSAVNIIVNNTTITDTTPPIVTLISPTSGPYSGTITLKANASDNVGVTEVEFIVDGNSVGKDIISPYEVSLNTQTLTSGPTNPHSITVKAKDAANNFAISYPPVMIIIDNNETNATNATEPVINGACGSSQGGSFSNAPLSGLCSSGEASSVTETTTTYTWTCTGNNSLAVSCFANRIIQVKCNYEYSSWSECKNGTRSRTVIYKYPDNCLIWEPILQETCTMPACSEDIWECTSWTTCSPEGKQQRQCNLIYDCPLKISSKEIVQNCIYSEPTIQTSNQNTNTAGGNSSTPTVAIVPEECVSAGFNNASDCEVYLHQMRVANECLSKGIKTQEECKTYLFENYGRPLKCLNKSDAECEFIIKNIILADLESSIDTETNQKLVDSTGSTATIQNNTLIVKDILTDQTKEIEVNLPTVETASVKLIGASNNSNQGTLSPVVIVFDTDGDGLPDDSEKRIGTDINKKDTDGDKIEDGEELRRKTNPLIAESKEEIPLSNIEKAIIQGESLEQPKYNEVKTSEDLKIETVENVLKEETGKNVIRIQGKGKPDEVVTLYLYSTMPIVVTAKADVNGNWVYDLDKTLVDGKHEVYVAINNDKGRIVESGLPKLFFVEEAKAVTMDDFIKMEDASNVPERSDELIQLYVVAGIVFIIIFVLIFLLIKRQMTNRYE